MNKHDLGYMFLKGVLDIAVKTASGVVYGFEKGGLSGAYESGIDAFEKAIKDDIHGPGLDDAGVVVR